jgi:hypothetical protein
MMGKNIPEGGLRERFTAIVAEENRIRVFRTRIKETISLALQSIQNPSYRLFRARQHLSYGLVTILLVMVLGGQSAWMRLVSEPGIPAFFGLILAFTNTLFSVEGLAALASYALVTVFFGFRFFNRYQKLLDRRAKEAAGEIEDALLSSWKAALEETAEDLKKETDILLSSIPAFYIETPLEDHRERYGTKTG